MRPEGHPHPRPAIALYDARHAPLGGAWSIDWLAGAAVLVGGRELKVTASTPNPPLSNTTNFSDNAAILNVDAQAGLSYWVNPNLKVTASYRFDGYFRALRTFNSAGNDPACGLPCNTCSMRYWKACIRKECASSLVCSSM